MSESLTFYTNPMSRGQIVRWMLQETGAEYKQEIIQFGEQMKSAEYLSINPMGKVPAIKHGDNIVTECAAICTYLADAFPAAKLAPNNRSDYYRWMFFAAGPLESAILNKSLGLQVEPDKEVTAGYGNYDIAVSSLDQWLGENDYVCGDSFSAADVYVGSQVDWGLQFNTLTTTDNFQAYAERLRGRPAYKQAKKIDADLIAEQTT